GIRDGHVTGVQTCALPISSLGESAVRLAVQPDGSLKPVDFFAPFNAPEMDTFDADFASGGLTVLNDQYFGTPGVPHIAVAVGKRSEERRVGKGGRVGCALV